MSDPKTPSYRPNVCMILFNAAKEILVAERFNQHNVWQFPQGGVEEGLTLEENVVKELEEELSLTAKDIAIRKRLTATHKYEWDVPPSAYKGKYVGQEQSFWLIEVLNPAAIDVAVDHPEFQQYRWVGVEAVLAVVEPIRIKGYLAPLEEVKQILQSI